jgi:hypothetical protein
MEENKDLDLMDKDKVPHDNRLFLYLQIDNKNIVRSLSIEQSEETDIKFEVQSIDEINNYRNNFNFLKYINDKIIIDEELKNSLNLLNDKNNRLNELKHNLEKTDYKIIKCYEAFMRQQTLPYNLEELTTQRDNWREEINQLEQELKNIYETL